MVDVEESMEEEYFSAEGDDDNEEDLEEAEISSSSGDEDEEGDDEKGQGEEDEKDEEVSGWADSIAKILKSNKPKNKKELMLSRARKDYEVSKAVRTAKTDNFKRKRAADTELEIVPNPTKPKLEAVEGEKVKEGKDSDDNILSLKLQRRLELKQKKLELAWENLARLNTEKTDPILERDLVKVATKGVVQLFNAISMQQKTTKTRLRGSSKSEFGRDKIIHQTKDIFDEAMTKSKKLGTSNNSTATTMDEEMEIKKEEPSSSEDEETRKVNADGTKPKRKLAANKKKPVWNALKDDFMLDAKLKDWDKDSDSD